MAFAVVIVAMIAAIRWRRRWLVWGTIGLILGPFAFGIARATVDYSMGSARLFDAPRPRRGVAALEWDSVHPLYRSFPRRPRYNSLLLGQALDALELRVGQGLFTMLGPMPGSYLGPYPSRQEALTAFRAASSVICADQLFGPFVVEQRRVRLSPKDLEHGLKYFSDDQPSDGRRLVATWIGRSCLLLGFVRQQTLFLELIDESSFFGWFARYSLIPPGETLPTEH